jgi:peptidoglycan/xylan/chitin deacetylase (PgdA/CDA1 family)
MHAEPTHGIMLGGANMERDLGVRNPPGEIPERARAVRRFSTAPHHRRRRVTALVALGAIVAVAILLLFVIGGSSADRVRAQESLALSGRGRALAVSRPISPAAREAAAQNAAINRTLAYTPYIRIAGAQHREIALTFDDGPGPYTPEILRILGREHVPATFFEVGVMERYFYAATASIVAAGDVIGDHTELHEAMSRLSPAQQRAQLLEQAAAVGRHDASFPRLFRPPDGLWNSTTLALLHRYRMLMVLWTVDTNDYRRPGVESIVKAAVSGARPGAIILLHDAGGNRAETVAALPRIIAQLRRRGYRLVTVPKLLLDNPPPHVQNIAAVLGAGG